MILTLNNFNHLKNTLLNRKVRVNFPNQTEEGRITEVEDGEVKYITVTLERTKEEELFYMDGDGFGSMDAVKIL